MHIILKGIVTVGIRLLNEDQYGVLVHKLFFICSLLSVHGANGDKGVIRRIRVHGFIRDRTWG